MKAVKVAANGSNRSARLVDHRAPRAALARVTRRVRGRDSVLVQVSRGLPRPRRRLFMAAYASMREIDDFVDIDFLGRAPSARAALRAAALARLERWRSEAGASAAGKTPPVTSCSDSLVALFHTVGRSDLGGGPWDRLGRALARDIAEKQIETWQDFLDYCEGAAVGPAEVFVYTLGCDIGDCREPGVVAWARNGLPLPSAHYARSLAVFCYLTHIVRDLAIDLGRNDQLVSIPRSLLAELGHDVASLREAVSASDWPRIRPVARAVLEFADPFRQQARHDLAALAEVVGPQQFDPLGRLAERYRGVFGELVDRWR